MAVIKDCTILVGDEPVGFGLTMDMSVRAVRVMGFDDLPLGWKCLLTMSLRQGPVTMECVVYDQRPDGSTVLMFTDANDYRTFTDMLHNTTHPHLSLSSEIGLGAQACAF